jgi:dihydroneopterin aldolase
MAASTSWQVRAQAGEPFAVVRVKNLQYMIEAGRDAWGRAHKMQPVMISAEVSLRRPFETASSTDLVSADTVHYGLLSKAILSILEEMGRQETRASSGSSARRDQRDEGHSLFAVFSSIWSELTGLSWPTGLEKVVETPFLKISRVSYLCVTVMFPKATLLGEGVSLTGSAVFSGEGGTSGSPVRTFGRCLRLHRLRVPTLVGINDNERKAKQVVIADVEIDKYPPALDIYPELEALVTTVRITPAMICN